jgi:hypothetical protein
MSMFEILDLIELPFQAIGRIGPRLIMIAAMVTSYSTQHGVFQVWKVDALTAYVAPAVIDILAISCAEILHDQWVIKGKLPAGFVLAAAGFGSMTVNWVAGTTPGSKAVHAGMVLAYVLCELVHGFVKRRSREAATESGSAVVQPAESAPVAPLSVVPAQGTGSQGPSGSTERRKRTGGVGLNRVSHS